MFKILYTSIIFFSIFNAFAQVGIGTTNPNAALDIVSSTNGILIPRVALISLNQSLPVLNPNGGSLVTGTLVYNTATTNDVVSGFYYWDGINWVSMKNSTSQPIVNQQIIHSVKGTTDIHTNSSTFVDMQGMSLTFTPTKNRVYVTLSVAGEISTNYYGQIYG